MTTVEIVDRIKSDANEMASRWRELADAMTPAASPFDEDAEGRAAQLRECADELMAMASRWGQA